MSKFENQLFILIKQYLDETLESRTSNEYTNLGYRVYRGSFEGFLNWLQKRRGKAPKESK